MTTLVVSAAASLGTGLLAYGLLAWSFSEIDTRLFGSLIGGAAVVAAALAGWFARRRQRAIAAATDVKKAG